MDSFTSTTDLDATSSVEASLGFVAINYIECTPDYVSRFETLFRSRARAIDKLPGFRHMHVLKPSKEGDAYLVVSHWDTEDQFKAWTTSPEFIEGHKRGFEDIRKAKESGLQPPMTSTFKTYTIITE
jgi:heme-degrading monooxygenase HmoA